jgi:hypothetical protein
MKPLLAARDTLTRMELIVGMHSRFLTQKQQEQRIKYVSLIRREVEEATSSQYTDQATKGVLDMILLIIEFNWDPSK